MRQYVGLSMSFCISQILRGDAKLEQVAFIVPGFDMSNWDEESPKRIPPHYFNIYWREWDRKVVEDLISKLDFRYGRKGGHNVAHGVWWHLDQWDISVLDDPEKRLHSIKE